MHHIKVKTRKVVCCLVRSVRFVCVCACVRAYVCVLATMTDRFSLKGLVHTNTRCGSKTVTGLYHLRLRKGRRPRIQP